MWLTIGNRRTPGVARLCDLILHRFCADEPVRKGGAVTWEAFDRVVRENEELRRERDDYGRALDKLASDDQEARP